MATYTKVIANSLASGLIVLAFSGSAAAIDIGNRDGGLGVSVDVSSGAGGSLGASVNAAAGSGSSRANVSSSTSIGGSGGTLNSGTTVSLGGGDDGVDGSRATISIGGGKTSAKTDPKAPKRGPRALSSDLRERVKSMSEEKLARLRIRCVDVTANPGAYDASLAELCRLFE